MCWDHGVKIICCRYVIKLSGGAGQLIHALKQPLDTPIRDDTMATKKTSIFSLTERLTIAANNTNTFGEISLASYVDVGDRQGVQVHSVEFIFQGTDAEESLFTTFGGDCTSFIQVTDLNRGGLVFADDRSLVASGTLHYGSGDNIVTNESDMFPDSYGKGADDGRFIVNDTLYLTGRTGVLATAKNLNVTVRVNCSIVTLSAKDFMSLAIQTTADN